jgi:hypothetical protein
MIDNTVRWSAPSSICAASRLIKAMRLEQKLIWTGSRPAAPAE